MTDRDRPDRTSVPWRARLVPVLLLVSLLARTPATAASSAPQAAASDAALQAALQSHRAAVQAQFDREQVRCMKTFFVNACLDQARRRERKALATIDSQRAALGVRERMRRAEIELQRVQRNLAQAQASAPVPGRAEEDAKRREAELHRREAEAGQPTGTSRPASSGPASENAAQRARAEAQARADHAAKVAAYRRKQAQLQRQQSAGPAAPALPVPPASAALDAP